MNWLKHSDTTTKLLVIILTLVISIIMYELIMAGMSFISTLCITFLSILLLFPAVVSLNDFLDEFVKENKKE